MQPFALRTLAVKLPINASKSCSCLTKRIAHRISHTRPAVCYNISRSVHARQEEELSDAESAMDAQKKPVSEAEAKTCDSHRDDMADSFGDAYSTRSSDEGFGGVYAPVERDANPHVEVRHVYDQSQGSEVTEKEKARHATQHTAFPAHNRHAPGGFGGTAT